MRNRIITVAKACSSTRAFSGTIEPVSTPKPNTVEEKGRHLDLIASSSGYLGTGNISSSVKQSQEDLTNAERYLCSVSKLVVDSYNKKNPGNH